MDDLVAGADLVVRGTIIEASQAAQGMLWAALRIEKMLKGIWPTEEIRFASDLQHGVPYAYGERVLVCLRCSGSGNGPIQLFSPQRLSDRERVLGVESEEAVFAGRVL